jgi:hypothetical protein
LLSHAPFTRSVWRKNEFGPFGDEKALILYPSQKQNFRISQTRWHISIEDLQDVEILRKRKNLSKNELSSMVFAKEMCLHYIARVVIAIKAPTVSS